MLTTAEEIAEGVGFCRTVKAAVRFDASMRVHCASARLPNCAPRNSKRDSYTDDDLGTNYEFMLSSFMAYLLKRRPVCFWIEEVPEFRTARLPSGENALDQLCSSTRALGYVSVYFTVNHNVWVEHAPRASLYIIGFHEDGGGGRDACKWFTDQASSMLKATRTEGFAYALWAGGGREGVLDPELKHLGADVEMAVVIEKFHCLI